MVEEKRELMQKLGKKQLILQLREPLQKVPEGLLQYHLELITDNQQLLYTFDASSTRTGITSLLDDLKIAGIQFTDIQTRQSSLEDIFVDLISKPKSANEPLESSPS